jgi:hypothetical protein
MSREIELTVRVSLPDDCAVNHRALSDGVRAFIVAIAPEAAVLANGYTLCDPERRFRRRHGIGRENPQSRIDRFMDRLEVMLDKLETQTEFRPCDPLVTYKPLVDAEFDDPAIAEFLRDPRHGTDIP